MVTPVHADKVIDANGHNRASHTKPSTNSDQATDKAPTSESHTPPSLQSRIEVDTARQLYQMENHRSEAIKSPIQTTDQARSVLGQILQQMQEMPEKALQSQASGANREIASLLAGHTVS